MNFPTDRIYKFSPFNHNSLTALATNSAWFSNVGALNDPFEAMIGFKAHSSEDERIASYVKAAAKSVEGKLSIGDSFMVALQRYCESPQKFMKEIESVVHEARDMQLDALKSLNVFSTSVDIPNYPRPHYANMLMWAHYAEGFSGFCLRFSASKLFESFGSLNPDSRINYCTMNYSNEAIELDVFECLGFSRVEFYKAIQQKHEQWIYEGELRFISNLNGLHKYAPEALEALYIGAKMPEGRRRVLMALICSYYPHVKVYEVNIYKATFQVVANEIKIR